MTTCSNGDATGVIRLTVKLHRIIEMAKTNLQSGVRLGWRIAWLVVVLELRRCAGTDPASQLIKCYNARYRAASSWDDYMNFRVAR